MTSVLTPGGGKGRSRRRLNDMLKRDNSAEEAVAVERHYRSEEPRDDGDGELK